MKKLLFLISIIYCSNAIAQDSALYKQFPFIPSFKLVRVSDSTLITKSDLPKKKPILVIIFSPDCDHCQHETEQLKQHIALFRKAHILMVSAMGYEPIKKFYEEYGLKDYKNITVAFDKPYYLGTFFRVRSFPAIYLYDKKGNFKREFEGSYPVEKIAAAL